MRLAWLLLIGAAACHHGGAKRDYPEPSVKDIVDKLATKRSELTSFKADSTMDYWLGNQRAKGEVLVMAKPGAKIRFAALSPAGGSTLAEMACDGQNFVYVDYQNNCALSGPCDKHSIEQFFHIALAPDDFLHLALGTPPVIDNPTGKVTWDGNAGVEKVELAAGNDTQKLTIDAKQGRWDVIDSDLTAGGKVVWSVSNADYKDVSGKRVPGKTRFKSPTEKEDLLVEWGDSREINVELTDDKFQLQPPQGLRSCK